MLTAESVLRYSAGAAEALLQAGYGAVYVRPLSSLVEFFDAFQ